VIIHRDLKPSNIMIDREGNVRIMDFGIARLLKSKGITGSGSMIGTPEYMSPEQVDGEKVDSRSDIYSLGVILYEIISGRLPFEGDTPLSIAVKHKQETPEDPLIHNPDTPLGLSRVILKCLEKNKDDRYDTVESLLDDLKKVDMIVPSTERALPKKKATGSKEITVSFSLKKLLLPAFVLIAVVAAGILIWQLSTRGNSVGVFSDKPCLGVLYFENYSGDPSLDYMRRAFSELMITDLADSLHIRVLRLDEIKQTLESMNLDHAQTYSLENIQQMGRRGGVEFIIRGSYIKTGENFRITTTLINTDTGETIFSLSAQAEGAQDLSLRLDDLAKEIKARIDIPPEQLAVQQALGDLQPPAVPQKK
jgi:TolB-like protein